MLALNMVKGKTGVFFLSVYEADGATPQSLVGATLWFHAALASQNFTLSKSSGAGITVTNSAGGANCATLQIEPGDTESLAIRTVVQMPCELTMQVGGEAYELASGMLAVIANVGTP